MRTPAALPDPFQRRPFRAAEARRSGVSRSRLRHPALHAPFVDVRAASIESVHDLAAAYATRMRDGHVFGGLTAARLWGLPVPTPWRPDEPLVIARPLGTTRGRAAGTRHIAFDPAFVAVGVHRGLPVLGPIGTALTIARELEHEPLVHLVDALLTPSKRYPDLELPGRPHIAPDALARHLERCRGLHGVPALRDALADARVGVDSRFETITRRTIVLAGLPEPAVHPRVVIDGIDLHPDLGYPQLHIAIEYEGDGHREAGRWDRDIDRYAMLEAAGWIVVRITKAHLARDGERCIARVRAALARRG